MSHNTNKACCTIPPVSSKYEPIGKYLEPGYGLGKTYVVGPDNSETAVICVFDIFGFWPQTIQGADIISSQLGVKVIMPDFFDNDPFPVENFPGGTDSHGNDLQTFFQTRAAFDKHVPKLLNAAEILREQGTKKLLAYGFCWGGKIVSIAGATSVNYGGQSIPAFDGVAIVHPAMVSTEDVDKIIVPLGLFPSKDEPKDVYDKAVDILKGKSWADKNAYHYFGETFHGFAAARANLDDAENVKHYTDLYSRLATFFTGI